MMAKSLADKLRDQASQNQIGDGFTAGVEAGLKARADRKKKKKKAKKKVAKRSFSDEVALGQRKSTIA
jgi:hypothetical protein